MTSIIPAQGEPVTIYQGRTLIITWTLHDDEAGEQLTDLTGWKGWLLIWGSDIATPVKVLSYLTGVAPDEVTEGVSGVILGDELGTIMAYLTDEDALQLNHAAFRAVRDEEGNVSYLGGIELVLEDLAEQRFPYEFSQAVFVRTAPIGA